MNLDAEQSKIQRPLPEQRRLWSYLFLFLITSLLAPLFTSAQTRNESYSEGRRAAATENPIKPENRIDINHATVEQLLEVHDMTRSWAARIVRFRPYRTKQDIYDRGVVTSQVYDRIKDGIIAHKNEQ